MGIPLAGMATIFAGTFITDPIDLTNSPITGLIMPVAFTGNQLSYQASLDSQNFYDVYVDGNPLIDPVGPKQWVRFDRDEFKAVPWLRIRSGSPLAPVAQQNDATFRLLGAAQTVQPNPRRTLTPEGHGYAGANFDDITPYESDAFTFDLVDRLSAFGQPPSESIASIERLSIVPVVGIDGNAALRELGIASISGTQVSQQFGGFLSGAIRYRIFVRVKTSNGNVISNWSYFWVKPPGFQ